MEHLKVLVGGGEVEFAFGEGCVGLNGQIVEREMGDGQSFEFVESTLKARVCLIGQLIHEIDRDVSDASCMGRFNGLDSSLGAVGPLEDLKGVVLQRLHSDARPVDAGSVVTLHERECDVFGVGFEGDFTIGCEGGIGRDRGEDFCDGLCAKKGGRSTTKIDRGDRVFDRGKNPLPFEQESIEKGIAMLFFIWDHVEMAVRTFARAKGDVDVERDHHSSASGSSRMPLFQRFLSLKGSSSSS